MSQQQDNPIYWDQAASRFNLTLIFSLIVAVLGMFMQAILLIILGLGMAGYSWLTTPRQFLLYRDSMVILYGMPRQRVISFAEISHVELLALPLGERLRIRMVSGSRLMLMMRDPGAFRGHLEDALARYHGEQTGAAYVEGAILQRGGEPEFGADHDYGAEADHDYGAESPEFTGMESEDGERLVDSGADASEFPEREAAASASYSETRSGSYTEFDDSGAVPEEPSPGIAQDSPVTSGSYSEASPEPDYSGEGQPMYGAEIEVDTGTSEEDHPERPRSPY